MTSTTDSIPGWKEALANFSAQVLPEIERIADNHGCLPADAVGRLIGEHYDNLGSLMMSLLKAASSYAVVPVSHYRVGAVAAGMPVAGTEWCNLYLGANFEFPNAALSLTVHAEQAATNNAWLQGEEGLQALAISAAPCGYCRQFLNELTTAKQLNILLPDNPGKPISYSSQPLTYYLPDAFGPADLNVTGGLMDPKPGNHNLTLPTAPLSDPVVAVALAAANASYAPYPTDSASGYAGVAVQIQDGSIYAGRHAENAAYNPSLSPLQSALSFMTMSHPSSAAAGPQAVRRCVLVEAPTLSSQLTATRTALAAYAPGISVEYYAAS